jgi:PAS domain-containing protein
MSAQADLPSMLTGASGAAGSASPTSPLLPQASSFESSQLRNCGWCSSIVSIMLLLTGALVFLGWAFGLPVLTSIIEASREAVVLIDSGGAIGFVNPAAEKLFGRSASDLLATTFLFPSHRAPK